MRFIHRPRGPAFSKADTVLSDYKNLDTVKFAAESEWTERFLAIQEYFEEHAANNCAQHPCLTMDGLNFVCEIREATNAYLDVYEHPDELHQLLEIGLDFNVRFQEAQMTRISPYADGNFVWLGDWVPFPRAVSLSVDAYVICSVQTYEQFGLEYQRRLIEHFGHGLMHFHCNRTDLAAAVAQLPLDLFQFGGDTRDPVSAVDRLREMRRAVGPVPIMVSCPLSVFRERLADRSLLPNVWYTVSGPSDLTVDDANRLMDRVRAYQVL